MSVRKSSKTLASQAIKSKIAEREEKIAELNKLILHAMKLAHARLHCSNEVGTDLSIRQVIKYTAQKNHAAKQVAALTELDLRVQWQGAPAVDYKREMKRIMEEPVPEFWRNDKGGAKDMLVREARKRILAANAC